LAINKNARKRLIVHALKDKSIGTYQKLENALAIDPYSDIDNVLCHNSFNNVWYPKILTNWS
jgi:hypothetical protein